MIDKAALDRIIAAVGKEPDDRETMASLIEFAYREYLINLSWKGTQAAKTTRLVKRIRIGLEKSTRLIASNPLIKRATSDYDLAALIKALRELEAWSAQPKRKGRKSAIDFLAGYQLAAIYDLIFGAAKNVKRVEFVEAALAELKLSRSRETIITAMRRYTEMRKKLPWEEMPSLEHVDMPEIVRKALQDKS
jgi:hypothetical protein